MWSNRIAMNSQKSLLLVFVLLSVLVVSACSSINRSDRPATQTWWLEPYSESTVPPVEAAKMLTVSLTAVPGLDTHRILTLSDNAELNKFAGQRWPDSLPELLTSLVSRSLDESGRFELVTGSSGASKCELKLEVQKFYATLNAAGRANGVQVALDGRYQCADTEAVLIRLHSAIPLTDGRISSVVSGFQQAVDNVMIDLLETI
jgi:ABC-type uncharacterized transport system auxiliary subunit